MSQDRLAQFCDLYPVIISTETSRPMQNHRSVEVIFYLGDADAEYNTACPATFNEAVFYAAGSVKFFAFFETGTCDQCLGRQRCSWLSSRFCRSCWRQRAAETFVIAPPQRRKSFRWSWELRHNHHPTRSWMVGRKVIEWLAPST